MKRRIVLVTVLSLTLVGGLGCSGRKRVNPILQLSSEEALARGKELMEKEKYSRARELLTHAFEAEPNSSSGREALLLVADSLYLQGGTTNLIQAEAKYRDFQNRFPTSSRADYVQLQIGNSLAARSEKPDRDQSTTRQAADAYQELIRLYPTSDYVETAEEKYKEVRAMIAEHEWEVGHFYMRFRMPLAAANRFDTLLEEFPEYPEIDRVLYELWRARTLLQQTEEADTAESRLREEYPQSPWIAELDQESSKLDSKLAKRKD